MWIIKNKVLSIDTTDLHGDTMTLDDRRVIRDSINISSSHLDHDYRNLPIGRIYSVRILNDGRNNRLV
jgi:hypothetical protein